MLDNKCIKCDSPDNLNTTLSIKLPDDTTASVRICDAHAEDITPKMARELYVEKLSKLQEIIKMARDNGLEVSFPTPAGSKLIVAQSSQAAAPTTNPAPTPIVPAEQEEERFLDGSIVRQKMGPVPAVMMPALPALAGATTGPALTREDISKVDLGKEKIKVDVVEGRSGQPVVVPTIIKDNSGTTSIRVKKSISDVDLQKHFKANADSNDPDGSNKHSFAKAHATRDCPFCNGSGVVSQVVNRVKTKIECPKCKGAGLITTF